MSNEHLLKPFPTNLSRSGSHGTGKQSEAIFIKQCESLGHEVYEPRSDRGIDFVIVTGNGCRKTIQVTAASPHPDSPNGFVVNKSISRIRTDVDILAIFVDHDELITVNLPLIGEVQIPKSHITGDDSHSWFLVPKQAVIHDNASKYYKFKSRVWYLRMDKLKQPLIAARENWGLLERKSMTGIEEQFGLKPRKKVGISQV
jgi:hypothetical protein